MKKRITIRIDEDVLEWFRSKGRGYQSAINDALRHSMNHACSVKPTITHTVCDDMDVKCKVTSSSYEIDELPKPDPFFKPMPKWGK